MSLSAILQPNNMALYEGTTFVPVFVASDGNTYTDLGSMYIRSNSGNQVNVVSKFRVLSNDTGAAAATMSLPIPASATLANVAIFSPAAMTVASSGATTLSMTNAVANNTALVIGLASPALTAITYNVTLVYSYNITAANN